MPSHDFLGASLPLFQAGEVDVMEWSFDTIWNGYEAPDWVTGLIDHYSAEGRLLGHGVMFSLLSGKWTAGHETWLCSFEQECAAHHYEHISEHYGFSRAGSVIDSSPLPVPVSSESIFLACERIRLLKDISQVPIGLENLGFAFSREDLISQAAFVSELLEKADGFLVLDLHNAFCQMTNFGVSSDEFLSLYPLHRVREIHISGGSVSHDRLGQPIRRDTHDGSVPEEVFGLLQEALRKCSGTRYVILERLSGTILSEFDASDFRHDFARIKSLVEQHATQTPAPNARDATGANFRSRLEAGAPRSAVHVDSSATGASTVDNKVLLPCDSAYPGSAGFQPASHPRQASNYPIESSADAGTARFGNRAEDNELAYFQEVLLDTFLRFSTAEEARSALLCDARLSSFHSQINQWEPRMLELAVLLTRKWAVRDD